MYNILICDDDRDIVSALDIYLTAEGYHTIAAYDGRQALKAVEENDVHLILMDVMMPNWTASGLPPSCGRRATCPSSSSPPNRRTRTRCWG